MTAQSLCEQPRLLVKSETILDTTGVEDENRSGCVRLLGATKWDSQV